jgi:hypothetical protein
VYKWFLRLLTVFVFHTTIYAADKIRIGTPPDPAHLTFRLAQKVGFLKAEGFDAEIITTGISVISPVSGSCVR